ncbi:NRS/ER [Penicillium capsulatum]|uniref:NRS/ER n=1 Tax=Penicillium capsulatum TaxID=69766 RepID=A0A9W9LDB5_9EURO|nr:NRS/ER [Penicillium capsulatum]KAJ6112357.1 NRS/ER [Penicillium capsulatum]
MQTGAKFLIFGNGWISGQIQDILKGKSEHYHVSKVRLEDRETVLRELKEVQPTHVINAAGVRGTPNVDWCEDHKEETIRANVVGATNLVDCCFLLGIHVTHFSSGCIYDYNETHQPGGDPYTEHDEPNFDRSFYSKTKIVSEKASHLSPFHFESGTICPNLLPGAVILAKNRETGLYNFTNPGAFTLSEAMQLIKKHLRPSLSWSTFSLEEQAQILKAPRCNLEMDSSKAVQKLKSYNYEVLECHEAMDQMFSEMRAKSIGVDDVK